MIIGWHLGVALADFAGAGTESLDPRTFWVAWERGDELTGDTSAREWDFWEHVDTPPDPADAADGECPHWCEPTT